MSGNNAVIVTGAAGGIGEELCRVFHHEGYYVIGLDRKTPPQQKHIDTYFERDLRELCGTSRNADSFLQPIKTALVGKKLCGLVNNAALQIVKRVEDLTVDDWKATMEVNLVAPFLLVQGLLPELEAACGAVVNISSIHGRLTKAEFCAYSTSKAALDGLTRSLAVELGERIRVNAIAPAAVETEMLKAGFQGENMAYEKLLHMHPVQRIGKPEEIARYAHFLISEREGFINGSICSVDGGIAARLHDPQ